MPTETTQPPWLPSERTQKRLLARRPDRPCWFYFCPDAAPHLILEPATAAGLVALEEAMAEDASGALSAFFLGAALTDTRGRLSFCGEGCDAAMLQALADWVRRTCAGAPVLTCLIDAGALDGTVDVGDPSSLSRLDLDEVERDPSLWEGILEPDAGHVAEALADALPGHRLWVWLGAPAAEGAPPLLLRRADRDPAMEQFGMLRNKAAAFGGRAGVGVITREGQVQLLVAGASRPDLDRVAGWARANLAAHPGLARLRDAAVLDVDPAGRVVAQHQDPALWEGFPSVVAPGTLAEAAAHLDALAPGEALWIFATPRDGGGQPALTLLPVAEDPLGARFNARVAVAGVGAVSPLTGLLLRREGGQLHLSAESEATDQWPELRAQLVAAWGAAFPALGALASVPWTRVGPRGVLAAGA